MKRPWLMNAAIAAAILWPGAGALGQDTVAVSRQVTVHLDGPWPTVAVSRQVTLHFAGLPATFATSRQVTMYANFSLGHAVSALRIAAGLQSATETEAAVFNLVGGIPGVDVGDAAQIARYAAGTASAP